MKFITDFLNKRKQSKIRKKISRLQQEALHLQRNGKLRHYAEVMSEISKLEKQLNE